MKQLDIFQNEKTQDISNSIESCIISFQEGASDDKSMSINWLESFKEKLQKGELNKSQVTKLIVDLCWEYDRMSSSGQETLDKLCKVLNIPIESEMDAHLASLSKEEINNIILNRCAYPSEDSR